jgi:hypothetical protein
MVFFVFEMHQKIFGSAQVFPFQGYGFTSLSSECQVQFPFPSA